MEKNTHIKCQEGIESPAGKEAKRAVRFPLGHWRCECGQLNGSLSKICSRCPRGKPEIFKGKNKK